MDHFARQDEARRKTGYLLWLYLLAIAGIIAVVYLVWQVFTEGPMWDAEALAWIAGGVIVIVGGGSLIKISQLGGGGGSVAEMLGGRLVDPATRDPQLRQLLNVVEEMALASGLPVPGVYVLAEDNSINAFAAGFTPDDAAVGVTRGTLERLTRDELQGVIAHEFSHILNGDMRLNVRLIGLLFGILCLAILGRLLFRIGLMARPSSSSEGKGVVGVLALAAAGGALFLIGMIGVFFARLIQAAVSRQREFLADAAAVQFTRNPQGIASALYKIGKYSGRISSVDAAEAGHLFFGNGLSEPWFGWLATHPPLAKRIAAIDPQFDPEGVRHRPPPVPKPMDGSGAAVPRNWMGQRPEPVVASMAPLISLAVGDELVGGVDAAAREEVRELGGAVALVYALLLDESEGVRGQQLAALQRAGVNAATLQATQRWYAQRADWNGEKRIALLDLAIPTLRGLSPRQYRDFRGQTQQLIGADGQVHLFEYLLQTALVRHLDRFYEPVRKSEPEIQHLLPVLPEVAVVLSAVAHVGQPGEKERSEAYRAGLRELLVKLDDPALERLRAPGIEALDQALKRLGRGSVGVRRQVLLAAAQVAMQSGGTNETEGQLLRILADALDCPVPPFVKPDEQS